MKTITLNLPDSIAEFYPRIGEKLFLLALRESIKRLVEDEQKNLETLKPRIKKFEQKYKMDFQTFQQNLSPDGDYQLHEDYGEWSYLVDVVTEINKDIANYQRLNGIVP